MDNKKSAKLESRRGFLINLFFFAAIVAITVLLARYASSYLMAFVIAFIVAAVLNPLLKLLNKKLRLPRKPTGVVLVLLFFLVIAVLLVVIGDRVFDAVKSLVGNLPNTWSSTIEPALLSINDSLNRLFTFLKVDISPSLSESLSYLGSNISSVSTELLGTMGNIATSIPSLLVNVIICVMSTMFILLDWDKIRDFIIRQLPERAATVFTKASSQLGKTIWQYVRSYGLILLITFTELFVGLLIIGFDNAFIIAAVIALFDILPVVGSGAVLLPWAIISFIIGNYANGIGLVILYVVIIVIRQIAEPRIIGQQVGMHPLVTLMAMVVGTSVWGALGLFGLPIALAVMKKLDDDGVINIIKKAPQAAPAEPLPEAAEIVPTGAEPLPEAAENAPADTKPIETSQNAAPRKKWNKRR